MSERGKSTWFFRRTFAPENHDKILLHIEFEYIK